MDKLINIAKVLMAFTLILFFGLVGTMLRILSFGLLTNFNRTFWIPLFSKISLRAMGIRLEDRTNFSSMDTPHFITFNHNSYLDGFVLMSLGLRNMRILMSEKMLIFLPVWLVSFSIGLLYIPMKNHPKRRMRYFLKVEELVLRDKMHIMGSSEGVHQYADRIAPFNRGVYHMAVKCQMPIIPMFIYTPIESNPYANFRPFKRGTVIIENMETVQTSHWKIENLDQHVADVRAKYVERFNEYYHLNTE